MPYAVTGNLWVHPELITISFQPDGTDLGGVPSNLFSKFNARFGSATTWQNQILRAAQTWAQYANLNFAVVGDSGAPSGSGDYQQGDPGFGDIRIGGLGFGSSSLALTYLPPQVNNYSIGGDMGFNTSQSYNIGSNYDLYTVALHEFGHALGLGHSNLANAVLYPSYNGMDYGLSSDDIAGIRAIYGARAADRYDAAASNGSFGSASDLTSLIDPETQTALVTGLDITSTTDADYFSFIAPSGASSVKLNVQSSGLSLLAPLVRVYNASQSQVAYASGLNKYGTTLSLTVNVTPGQRYYILVDGADNSVFGTGAYALTLNFGSGASPTVPLPDTRTANGDPLNGGGGLANRRDAEGDVVAGLLDVLGGAVNLLGGLLRGLTGQKHVESEYFHTFEVSDMGHDHPHEADVPLSLALLTGGRRGGFPDALRPDDPGLDAQRKTDSWWQGAFGMRTEGGRRLVDRGEDSPAPKTAPPDTVFEAGLADEVWATYAADGGEELPAL